MRRNWRQLTAKRSIDAPCRWRLFLEFLYFLSLLFSSINYPAFFSLHNSIYLSFKPRPVHMRGPRKKRAHKCVIYAENRNYVASEREWIKTFNHYTDVWAYGAATQQWGMWERRKNNQTHKLDLDGEIMRKKGQDTAKEVKMIRVERRGIWTCYLWL